MKTTKLIIMPILLAAAVVAFIACPGARTAGGSGGGDVTVTFESGIGSEVAPVTVSAGALVPEPAEPAFTKTGLLTQFRGWYTDDDFTKNPAPAKFNFTTDRVFSDITLYADYGYRRGDTGPAGGTVFYRNDTGFTVYKLGANSGPAPTYTPYPDYTAYYLEAAPQDEQKSTWAQNNASLPTTPAARYEKSSTGGIGWGSHNTYLIISPVIEYGENFTACTPAVSCSNASYGGFSDWFLPNRAEIQQLCSARDVVLGLVTSISPENSSTTYWTSSRYDYQSIWTHNFSNNFPDPQVRSAMNNVRAIRAF